MISRIRGTGACFLVLAVGIFCIMTGGAAAAEPSPVWQINQATAPTNLEPGTEAKGGEAKEALPRWTIFVTNVGESPAMNATVTATLPPGIVTSPFISPVIAMPNGPVNVTEPCSVASNVVTCEITRPTQPGRQNLIYIPLSVDPAMKGIVVNQVSVTGGGAATVTDSATATISSSAAPFGLLDGKGLRGVIDGASEQAGGHPFQVEIGAEVTTKAVRGALLLPSEGLRRFAFQLPAGLVIDPSAVPVRCTAAELATQELPGGEVGCPVASQVGVVYPDLSQIGRAPYPLYSMVPPAGKPAELAFSFDGVVVNVLGGVDGSFRLTAESDELLSHYPFIAADAFLWGVPSDPAHDSLRYGKGCLTHFGCSMEPASPAPFVSLPSSCSEAIEVTGTANSWLGPEDRRTVPVSEAVGSQLQLADCGSLAFAPTFEATPTTDAAEQPAGLDVHIHQPQDESLDGRATATLKDVKVTLPEGMTLNAAAGNGLASCSEQEIGYDPDLEPGRVRFSTTPQSCPDAAKVGTVEVTTRLLKGTAEEVLSGSVYVAKPFDNPFGSLLAVYLAIEGRKTGIVAKLAGKVEPDPRTGQLTATFRDNPQLPIEDIRVQFFKGENATLTTPISCGTKTTNATLTPWSTPEGADAQLSDSFDTSRGCASSEAAAPKTFNFTAGTVSPLSGAYSPFVLRISRPDGSQHITGIETTLPSGLLGKLAGVSYCPESGIAQAISREAPEKGKLEQQNPSCPSSSEVGTVNVTAGSGSNPIPVSGHAYLAGPYKGAPLSLVAIALAVAGPFDLGTVVDRVALNVGEYDARIHAVADPLPTIREGIPVDVRSIELKLDRPSFTLNPTSCEAMQIEGQVSTQAGQTAGLSNRFQVGECGRLGFKPSLKISLKGATKRTGHPALKATVTYPKKGEYANIARAQVNLPHSEFLDQGNIGKACTKVLIAQRACPAKSIYGKVKAWTPLLEEPLEGPVYLVGGYGYKLPAMVAELNGQIRVLLVGKVDTGKNKGIRNTFEAVPDAPVGKFVLELKGGKKYGLLENSENICKKKQLAGASFKAQNGRVKTFSVKIANSCHKGKKKAHEKHKGPKGKKG
ncbi:MAG: hypothetical protein JST59_20645 [Actinobacteria bacterium]|nr:hypothetical protein [Actinomycetota bacterium]